MKSKAYERYELHPRRKLLEALADLIPEHGGWVLICDDEKIMSFDIDSTWDYGSSDSIIELANTSNDVKDLQKRQAELETEVRSKTQKVAKLNKALADPLPPQKETEA